MYIYIIYIYIESCTGQSLLLSLSLLRHGSLLGSSTGQDAFLRKFPDRAECCVTSFDMQVYVIFDIGMRMCAWISTHSPLTDRFRFPDPRSCRLCCDCYGLGMCFCTCLGSSSNSKPFMRLEAASPMQPPEQQAPQFELAMHPWIINVCHVTGFKDDDIQFNECMPR